MGDLDLLPQAGQVFNVMKFSSIVTGSKTLPFTPPALQEASRKHAWRRTMAKD